MTYTPYPSAAAEAADMLRLTAGQSDANAAEAERRFGPPRATANARAVAEELRRAADWLDQQADDDEYAPPDSLGFTLPGDLTDEDDGAFDPWPLPGERNERDANPGGGDHIPAPRPID